MSAQPIQPGPEKARSDVQAGARVFAVRLCAAALQAAALYGLMSSASDPVAWPATIPGLFLPLGLIGAGVPLRIILGAGRLPALALTAWAVGASVLLAALGAYDVARRAQAALNSQEALLPWWPLIPALLGGFFVANVLVTDTMMARRWLPPYASHIDTAWKHGLQAVFAAMFAGLFWSVLALGAGLFQVLNIDWLTVLILQPWFFIPATTLAVAVAVHVTDVQPVLIRGARTVALALLSWLLPLLATILLAFLAVLPFTSLALLWQTHNAAVLLLGAAGCLIVLINAAYGDGEAWSGSRIKQAAAVAASLELAPLLGLAVWALMLRVGQYGWTVNRIFAAAGLLVLCWHAAGYVAASLSRRARWHEATNFTGAYLTLLIILLLLSPVADPARLMVASQVARLQSGAVSPGAFDFAALHDDGARWGAAALVRLQADPSVAAAAARQKTGQLASRDPDPEDKQVLTPEELAGRITVLPPGRTLPASLLHADFSSVYPPNCFLAGSEVCTIRFISLVENAPESALLLTGATVTVFVQPALNHWRQAGVLAGPVGCAGIQARLKDGTFTLIPHPARDISIDGVQLTLRQLDPGCP